jgi:DNA repair protein SbcD/Mre11
MNSLKFMHIADLHLGKRQYNIPQRYYDYFRAFKTVLNKAIDQAVDFILISGDMIDSDERVSPTVLREIILSIKAFQVQSQSKLEREIPLICIEGNHENPFFTDHTWLRLLADLGLIILLSGTYDNKNNSITFEEYDSHTHIGGKIRIDKTVIYGLSYFGSSTSELFPLLSNAIGKSEKEFSILMMHFGINEYDERKTGIEFSPKLQELNKMVDYLALGHFHNQYTIPEKNPWVFNPGSLEVNDIVETKTDRGAFLVELFENKKVEVRKLLCENGNSSDTFSIPNRRFFVPNPINISGKNTFAEAQEFVLDYLQKYGIPLKSDKNLDRSNLDLPVIYIIIRGIIGYSQLEVDLLNLKQKIREKFDILGLRMSNKLISTMESDIDLDDDLNIDQIEKQVFLGTIESENHFEPFKDKIFSIFSDLKNQFDTKNPRYKKVASLIESWFNSDKDLFNQFFQDLDQERMVKKKVKPHSKKSKKTIQKKKQLGTEDEAELDFSEIDYSDLLDDETNIDDLIDDGDLDDEEI